MNALEILEVLEAIASSMYERTRDPYWKEQIEWIKRQKLEEARRKLMLKYYEPIAS